ncbi:MAG: M20/M25/M40 family metallo-hydrolase [Pseudomonadota bacterium]|nr:M20/M25/M40 family metallo-hydrolase [Pseudomonadota bacterium]
MRGRALAGAALAAFLAGTAAAEELTADQAKALEMFRELIAFKTVKGEGQVPKMAAYLAREFTAAGFAPADIEIMPVDETAGMVVKYRGDGTSGSAPILFLAHMDVVPALSGDWDFDPWTLVEKDGRFYGRGSVDNKYGVLTLAQAFIGLKKEGFRPTRDLILVFTGDEESGMATTRMLAEKFKDAEYALNADAGGLFTPPGENLTPAYYIQAAEKTYATFEMMARNEGGHSSAPRPDNAIYDLAAALKKIEAYSFPVMWNDVTLSDMAASSEIETGKVAAALKAFVKKPGDKKAAKTLLGVDYIANSMRTTCVATMLKAGHAENALPQTATATVNCRIFPGVAVEDVKAELARVVDNPALEFTTLGAPVESPASLPTPELQAAALAAARAQAPVERVISYLEAGGTDGMHFRRAGVPTFGVGPMYFKDDNITGIHGKDEGMTTETFYSGLRHWPVLIRKLAGDRGAE